jgi:hypothetical protein
VIGPRRDACWRCLGVGGGGVSAVLRGPEDVSIDAMTSRRKAACAELRQKCRIANYTTREKCFLHPIHIHIHIHIRTLLSLSNARLPACRRESKRCIVVSLSVIIHRRCVVGLWPHAFSVCRRERKPRDARNTHQAKPKQKGY